MQWVLFLVLAQEPVVQSDGSQVEASSDALLEDAYAATAARQWDDAARLWATIADASAAPGARELQAHALYMSGRVRRAEAALEGVESPAADNLRGLILLDRGQQAAGVASLRKAADSDDPVAAPSARVNLARVLCDQGQLDQGRAAYAAVAQQADDAGQTAIAAEARAGAGSCGPGAQDPAAGVDAVGAALRRGSVAAARAEVDRMPTETPRDRIALGLAHGAVLRASGRPDDAAAVLTEALTLARENGLAWETSQCLFQLGVAHGLAGRHDLAQAMLIEADQVALDGGFTATAAEIELELGRVLLRAGATDQAQVWADKAQGLLAKQSNPLAQARSAELAGALAGSRGESESAQGQLDAAYQAYVGLGAYADGARVAVAGVRVFGPEAQAWEDRAITLYDQIGDPLGPAHVKQAAGLALAERGELEAALQAFSDASELARATGRPQGEAVALAAEKNAAQALIALGASQEGAERAVSDGVGAAVEHQRALQAALGDYDAGLSAYAEGRFGDARRSFDAAATALLALGETVYAEQAQRALAWASYNQAVSLPPEQAQIFWAEIEAEALRLDDRELVARSRAEAAIADTRMGHTKPAAKLEDAARYAESVGLPQVAARCWAERSEQPLELTERARDARRAYALAPDSPSSSYAMYSVAVDAYNADQPELAHSLAEEVLPTAGELHDAVVSILDATSG
jgi:hypothetical protein